MHDSIDNCCWSDSEKLLSKHVMLVKTFTRSPKATSSAKDQCSPLLRLQGIYSEKVCRTDCLQFGLHL